MKDGARNTINAKVKSLKKGDGAAVSATLKDKLPRESLQKLHIADSITTAVGDQPENDQGDQRP